MGAVVLIALPLTTAAKCDPANQEPKTVGTYKIEHKRRPCGEDGVCSEGETKCWQFQLHNNLSGRTEFRCVPREDWDGYAVGAVYP